MRPERIAWKGARALANGIVRRPSFATALCNILYWEMGSNCPSNLQHGLLPLAKSSVVRSSPREYLWGGVRRPGRRKVKKQQIRVARSDVRSALCSPSPPNPVLLPMCVLEAGCSWKDFAIFPDCSRSCLCTCSIRGAVRCPSHPPRVSFLSSCGAWLPFSAT